MSRLLERCGVRCTPGFLETTLCAELAAALAADAGVPAPVFAPPGASDVQPSTRHARDHEVESDLVADVGRRLAAHTPALASQFGLPLTWCEEPSFLTYGVGEFYRPHTDSTRLSNQGDASTREVSAVLFLNSGGGADFDGGQLVFYDLLGGDAWRGVGFPLDPLAGMLVAFRSDVLHEVTPVVRGRRAVAATWFHRGPRP